MPISETVRLSIIDNAVMDKYGRRVEQLKAESLQLAVHLYDVKFAEALPHLDALHKLYPDMFFQPEGNISILVEVDDKTVMLLAPDLQQNRRWSRGTRASKKTRFPVKRPVPHGYVALHVEVTELALPRIEQHNGEVERLVTEICEYVKTLDTLISKVPTLVRLRKLWPSGEKYMPEKHERAAPIPATDVPAPTEFSKLEGSK